MSWVWLGSAVAGALGGLAVCLAAICAGRLKEARRALHRYRTAIRVAYRWLGGIDGAAETASWVGSVGEGRRGCDIEQFRESLNHMAPTPGARLIAAERRRQISEERRSAKADDKYTGGELAWAAACYAVPAEGRETVGGLPGIGASRIADRLARRIAELPDRNSPEGTPEMMLVTGEELRAALLDEMAVRSGPPLAWPDSWASESWKPADNPADAGQRIRELTKAGALIAAEMDRLMRTTTKGLGQ